MLLSDITEGSLSVRTESQVFVFEVNGLRSFFGSANLKSPIRQSGRKEFTVPYSRMSREIRRIALQGGKIVSIRPSSTRREGDDSSKRDLAWWIQISTQQPQSLLYFGPYETPNEAKSELSGYIEDLREEGAAGITVELQQCQPKQLTICNIA